jgi:hypothetical protein
MDPTLKFVIESACWTGLLLFVRLSAYAFGLRRWDWSQWLVGIGLLVPFIVGFYFNSWGGSDIFPAVVGFSIFVAGVMGTAVGGRGVWLLAHRGHHGRLDELAATNFGAMVMYVVLAAIFLVFALMTHLEIQQGAQAAYEQAPVCGEAPSTACRSQTEAIVVRTWAEGRNAPRLIEVSTDGRLETIKIRSAWNVWETLVEGQRVQLMSWKGKVTAVAVPGVGIMQTEDSPSLNGFVLWVMYWFVLLPGGLLFAFYGLVYAYKCWAATQGDDTRDMDPAA